MSHFNTLEGKFKYNKYYVSNLYYGNFLCYDFLLCGIERIPYTGERYFSATPAFLLIYRTFHC